MEDGVAIVLAICVILVVFRWLLGTDNQNAGRRSNNITSRQRMVTPDMIETVRTMFPHIPIAAVRADLAKTGSVAATCDNILRDGSLPVPTQPATTAPQPSASSSSTTPVLENLVQRYQLPTHRDTSTPLPEEPQKVWGSSAAERQNTLQKRKEFMVMQARMRLLRKEEAKTKNGDRRTAKGDALPLEIDMTETIRKRTAEVIEDR